jgi:two-component system, LytTR family, sensor kinase
MERLANYILEIYPIENVPFKQRVILHGVFWGSMFTVLLLLGGTSTNGIWYLLAAALSRLITVSSFFYLFIYIVPTLYNNENNKIVKFLIPISAITIFYLFLAFVSYEWSAFVIKNNLISEVNNKKQYDVNLKFYRSGLWSYFKPTTMLADITGHLIYSLPAIFLMFIRIYVKALIEKKQLEIDFLRLQINPHFLVNTLNNIYSLVVVEDQRSPNAILSLSNLLNYVLYESSFPMVTVEKEIRFLQDFATLEQIRNFSKVQVKIDVEGELKGEIAPLILIAFIENAFKHGVGDSTIQSYVHVNIKLENETLFLSVINSKARKASEKIKKSLGGIGLVNVQKRLNSLYPNRHSLEIIAEPNKHRIVLVIDLT